VWYILLQFLKWNASRQTPHLKEIRYVILQEFCYKWKADGGERDHDASKCQERAPGACGIVVTTVLLSLPKENLR
jgi:hypothetical protein